MDCFICPYLINWSHKSWVLQHTYDAFKKMLEHLHHVVLNKFKSDLEQSLRSGEGFAASARYCVQSSMAEFDAGLRGKQTTAKIYWD